MAHKVICKYCGKQFDRDREPYIQVSAKRYAHKICSEQYEANLTKEERDFIELEKYIQNTIPNLVFPKVKAQLKKFKEDYNYTYSGIKKTLIYFYEIKKNDINKSNGGIAIVPYIYNEAREYYKNMEQIKMANEGKKISQYIPPTVEIIIKSPKRRIKKKRKFSFLDEEE